MTGSSATGKKILESAAPKMKRLVLELGGKDPMMVLADADLDKAAQDAVQYSVNNAGQVCCSVERVYVAESVYDDFQRLVVKHAATYKVGNGMDEGVKVGPLVSKMQRDIVALHVEDALQKGAKLLYQGEIPKEPGDDTSYFPVTVVADVSSEMEIQRKETFGPVVCLIPYGSDNDNDDDKEAVRLANDTNYGLAAAVYSGNTERARRVASQIQAGCIGINAYSLDHMDVACPWVGHKESGFGCHSGQEGFLSFSTPKSLIHFPY